MRRADLLTAVTNLENELRDGGRDNRHVSQRRMNSRRAHLGTGYLQEAGDGALSQFYFHLKGVQRRCEAEARLDVLFDSLVQSWMDEKDRMGLDDDSVDRFIKKLKKGLSDDGNTDMDDEG